MEREERLYFRCPCPACRGNTSRPQILKQCKGGGNAMLFDFRSGNINEGSTHIIHQSALPLKSPAPNSLEEQKSRLETSRSRSRMRGASVYGVYGRKHIPKGYTCTVFRDKMSWPHSHQKHQMQTYVCTLQLKLALFLLGLPRTILYAL